MVDVVHEPDSKYSFLEFECKGGGTCHVRIVRGKQYTDNVGCVWGWDGNVNSPSVVPSIKCGKCGLHVNVTAGVAHPV